MVKTTLAGIQQELSKRPGRTMMLEPWVFADNWESKPKAAVCIGLRLMSENDKGVARRDSEELALKTHPKGGVNAVDAYNDALMRHVCAFGICDPNDVTQPWASMELPEVEVRIALTTRGVQHIFEAIRKYETESSPLHREITEDEYSELVLRVDDGALERLTPARAKLARKFLAYALDELREAAEDAA